VRDILRNLTHELNKTAVAVTRNTNFASAAGSAHRHRRRPHRPFVAAGVTACVPGAASSATTSRRSAAISGCPSATAKRPARVEENP